MQQADCIGGYLEQLLNVLGLQVLEISLFDSRSDKGRRPQQGTEQSKVSSRSAGSDDVRRCVMYPFAAPLLPRTIRAV